MSSLYGSVGGSVVGGGEPDLHVEGGHDVLVEVRNERIPIVGHRHVRNPVPTRPLKKSFAALLRRCCPHGKTFQPTTGTIQTGEEEAVTLRLWEGANHIQMYGRESLVRYRKMTHSWINRS